MTPAPQDGTALSCIVVCATIADARVTDASADIRLNHSVHFRIAAKFQFELLVFEHWVPGKLRCWNKISRIKFVILVVDALKVLKNICQLTHVARKIKLEIIFKWAAIKTGPHALCVVVINLLAFFTSQSAEKCFARRKCAFVKLFERI